MIEQIVMLFVCVVMGIFLYFVLGETTDSVKARRISASIIFILGYPLTVLLSTVIGGLSVLIGPMIMALSACFIILSLWTRDETKRREHAARESRLRDILATEPIHCSKTAYLKWYDSGVAESIAWTKATGFPLSKDLHAACRKVSEKREAFISGAWDCIADYCDELGKTGHTVTFFDVVGAGDTVRLGIVDSQGRRITLDVCVCSEDDTVHSQHFLMAFGATTRLLVGMDWVDPVAHIRRALATSSLIDEAVSMDGTTIIVSFGYAGNNKYLCHAMLLCSLSASDLRAARCSVFQGYATILEQAGYGKVSISYDKSEEIQWVKGEAVSPVGLPIQFECSDIENGRLSIDFRRSLHDCIEIVASMDWDDAEESFRQNQRVAEWSDSKAAFKQQYTFTKVGLCLFIIKVPRKFTFSIRVDRDAFIKRQQMVPPTVRRKSAGAGVVEQGGGQKEGQTEKRLVDFDSMNGHEFERFCASLLRANGYTNVCVTVGSGDQGIDVLAERDGVKYGIQCKCYSQDVGNAAVREAYAGKAFYDCHVAVVLTNRGFTQAAIDAAKGVGVVLWDRNKLLKLINGDA